MSMQYIKSEASVPVECSVVGHFVSQTPWAHQARTMDSYEIIIGIKETLYLSIDNVEYTIGPGQVLLIPAHSPHAGYKICNPGISFNYFHFHFNRKVKTLHTAEIKKELLAIQSYADMKRKNPNIYLPIFFTPKDIDKINILFNQLIHTDQSDSFSHFRVDYLATSILIELSEQILASLIDTTQLIDIKLAAIIEWIHVNISSDQLSSKTIAQHFNYNQDYLARIFKKGMGVTVTEYIHLQKIAKAKDLLIHTNLSIKNIAFDLGFQDEKYFMRVFKKYMRLTPTSFRKAYYLKSIHTH